MYNSLSRAVSLLLEELYFRTECVTDYRGLLTSRPPGGGGGLTATLWRRAADRAGTLVIAPNLPKANKAKHKNPNFRAYHSFGPRGGRGGALGYFLGGYVPPGTPNWHPVLEKISPKIDTPF